MSTPQSIFNLAIYLIDGADDQTGLVDTGENRPFRHRAIPILNILQRECAVAAEKASFQKGVRYLPLPITGWDQEMDLDEFICQCVLPYGLAGHLLAEENPDLADFFTGRYKDLLGEAKRNIPASFAPISNPYGGIEHSAMGQWEV